MAATRLRIFISSVQKELAEERRAVTSFVESDDSHYVVRRKQRAIYETYGTLSGLEE